MLESRLEWVVRRGPGSESRACVMDCHSSVKAWGSNLTVLEGWRARRMAEAKSERAAKESMVKEVTWSGFRTAAIKRDTCSRLAVGRMAVTELNCRVNGR